MGTTVDVDINGTVVTGLAVAGGYVPQVGDTVPVEIVNGDALVGSPRDAPAGYLIEAVEGDETGLGAVPVGSQQLLTTINLAVQGPAGTAARPVHVVFGFVGNLSGNSAGFFWIDIDGATPLPARRWHTEGDSGTWPWVWMGVVAIAPGEHALNLWASNDTGSLSVLNWVFPRIDAFQTG